MTYIEDLQNPGAVKRKPGATTAMQPGTVVSALAQPQAQPASAPVQLGQPQFMQAGINLANPETAVGYGQAQRIERQGNYGGKGGLSYLLSGMGDQNVITAKAATPGGKLNEFTGVGTGQASTPGTIAINSMPAEAMQTIDPNLSRSVSQALTAATDRGDWEAVKKYYHNQGQSFGGAAPPLPYAPDVMKALADIETAKAKQAHEMAQAETQRGQLAVNQGQLSVNQALAGTNQQKAQAEIAALGETAIDTKEIRAARKAYQGALDKGDAAGMTKARSLLVALGALKDVEPHDIKVTPDQMGGAYVTQGNTVSRIDMKGNVAKVLGSPAPAAAGTASPKVGEQRTINGVPAVWDGKGWKAA